MHHPSASVLTADAPLVLPGDADHLLLNHGLVAAAQPDLAGGWHFNLFNNNWQVAFPQWYPYQDFDGDAQFRFQVVFK